MKFSSSAVLLVGLGLVAGSAVAAPGYVDDSGASIVRTGFGDCLHTGRWSKENAIAECDPDLVAVAAPPVEMAAVEVLVEKELKPIKLEADALFAFDSATLTEEGQARLDKALSNEEIRTLITAVGTG
ncbi:MAG: hypothetical protein R3308_07970, partial [Thiohalobacterales bacterium]|nr:hypothetical protein [Thiohalobacterales bacterium]